MRFTTDEELTLFAASVRGALASWEAPLRPDFGAWWDEHDATLAERLAALGFARLWADQELLGAAVAGAIELGRAGAAISLVDEATLGAPLAVGSRVRHARGSAVAALPHVGGIAICPVADTVTEATLDGSGTVVSRAPLVAGEAAVDGDERLRAWSAATLGYLAGLAGEAVDRAVDYVQGREQFGAPLAALPAVQARLADAALAADGITLLAWAAAVVDPERPAVPTGELLWAATACREVAASVLQSYGAVGFALETGVHRAYRRAASLEVWVRAVVREVAIEPHGS